ncbi:hypothetical protein EON65_51250, partial [archaeon]
SRKLLVCDLQGTLAINSTGSPVFLLTDPCIHFKQENSYDKPKFGRTDKGSKGHSDFFCTHHCNVVCEILGIKDQH